jgi:deoxyguanosine kinase
MIRAPDGRVGAIFGISPDLRRCDQDRRPGKGEAVYAPAPGLSSGVRITAHQKNPRLPRRFEMMVSPPRQQKHGTPRYIVVEGPIGVGKTTLTRRLARSLGSEAMLELPAENPFLERFYAAPRQYALPTQLYFLFQRVRQLERLNQSDMFRPAWISDFFLEKDLLFAELNLDDDELDLYRKVYHSLSPKAPVPDLVVFLQAPVEVLVERIRKRGVGFEQQVSYEYLEQLVNSYASFFLRYNAAPLLMVNAESINFADKDKDYDLLLDYIRKTRSGRQFFNPMTN